MYRSQLLFLAICLLAVFSEAKDKKKDKAKGDKKLKAKSLDVNITSSTWPEPDDKAKDWLLDKDNRNFLDKWQKLAEGEVKKLGAISQNNFSAEGVCNKQYKCETITFGSTANIDKDVKNPAKALKQITMKNMDKFLDHVKKRKPLKLTHHVQKDSLMAAEIHHAGIVVRVTQRNGTEVNSEHIAALAFDAYKYIIMNSEPTAVRAMGVQPDGKPKREISLCLFPKGANKAQADNFCRGRDAEADEEDEKEAKKGKEKKKGGDDDDSDSCSVDEDKADKGSQNKLIDMIKSMLGIKSEEKKDKAAKKCDPDTKSAKKSKNAKKEKKAGSKEAKKEEKSEHDKEEGKDKKKEAAFELEQVIIKVAAKKSDKDDLNKEDGAADTPDESDPEDESADKKEEMKGAKSEDGKPKSANKDKSATKKAITKKLEKAVKKAEKAVKKAEKAAKKVAKVVKKDKTTEKVEKATTTSTSEKDTPATSSTKTKTSSSRTSTTTPTAKKAAVKVATKNAAKKNDGKKTGAEKPHDDSDADDKKDDKNLVGRSAESDAEPEAAYFGAESMDRLYGRSSNLINGQYRPQYPRPSQHEINRQAQVNALRRRQQILRARALARRGLDHEDEETMLRARFIREPRLRRDAMPEPEPKPEPEPEPEPESEPEPEADPQKPRGYLLSREFFDDIEHLLARQPAEFHNEAQELFERGLGLDEAPEYYEW